MSECVSVGLRGGAYFPRSGACAALCVLGLYFHCSVETIVLINAQFKSQTCVTAADGLLLGAAVRFEISRHDSEMRLPRLIMCL